MITIEQSLQSKNIRNLRSKRFAKKDSVANKFTKSVESTGGESTSEINPLNPFLFLQDIGEYKDDQEKLKEAGSKILISLNDIKLGLINGELQEEHILKLKNALEASRYQFKFLELQNVIDDIILRSEVELAKIEVSKKNP